MSERANSYQVGGDHYRRHKIQPWDIVKEYGLCFFAGNALKYLLRKKPGVPRIEDLKKCRHYLDMMIEHEEHAAAVELHARHTLLAKKCLEEARAHVRAPKPNYDPDEVKFTLGDGCPPAGRTAHYWGSMEQAADVEGLL